jgi:hypothetical protein
VPLSHHCGSFSKCIHGLGVSIKYFLVHPPNTEIKKWNKRFGIATATGRAYVDGEVAVELDEMYVRFFRCCWCF